MDKTENIGDVIRDAEESDLPRIVEIYNASIPGRMATADTETVTVESRQNWFLQHDSTTRPLWVLERNFPQTANSEQLTSPKLSIIAWISINSFYGRPAYNGTAEFSLYVAPGYQHQGVGSYLLQAMIDSCGKFDVNILLGFVFGHNIPSLRLCEKFGFDRWGFLPDVAELDNQKRDLVIMGLKIKNQTRMIKR
jgi:L-amino acid N-acyltransferase YncA